MRRSNGCARRLTVLMAAAIAVFLAVMPASVSYAQSQTDANLAGNPTSGPSPNDVRELMRLLADPTMRDWLAESASRQPDLSISPPKVFDLRQDLAFATNAVHERLSQLSELWSDVPAAVELLEESLKKQLSESEYLRTLTYALIFLFIGASCEWLYYQYVKSRLLQIVYSVQSTFSGKMRTIFVRTGLMFGAITAFAIGSIGGFLLFSWPQVIREITLDLLIAILLFRLVIVLSKIVLAPQYPNLRMVSFSSKQARSIFRWAIGLFGAGLFLNFISRLFSQMLGALENSDTAQLVVSINVFNATFFAMLVVAGIWSIKRHFIPVSTKRANFRGRFLNAWPTYLTMLVLATLVLVILNAGQITGSLLLVGLLFPANFVSGKWVESLFDQASAFASSSSDQIAAVSDTKNIDLTPSEAVVNQSGRVELYEIYRSITLRLVRFFVVISAIAILILLWDINLFALSASQSLSGRIFNVVVDTLFAFLMADLIWHWAKSAIDRRLSDYSPPLDGQAPGPEARMATLLPMLRMMLLATLLIIVVLSVLNSLGVNIAPLLAGAGVVGVAIGFGAQALVRDVVSGIFFLIDDAFRIGEYIEIDQLRGTVESMSIRSLRVRHHRGMIHTIPFGELKSLTNYSRDWVIMKLEFRVPFDTDLQLVKKLVKKIGAELLENEAYGKSILETLKSQGVRRMEEFNMVVGVKFMTKPGEQWLIRRDAYQKVRDAFDAHGIGFAERNVKVQVVSDHPIDDATREKVVGAAQDAIEQRMSLAPVRDEP